MGQREDVTASLLASHGVDGVARRKVADSVKAVAVEAAQTAAVRAAMGGDPKDAIRDAGLAASAVVLASDLRAPAAWGPCDPAADFAAAAAMAEREEPSTFEAVQAVYRQAAGEIEPMISPNRMGWRARLANVERLLSEGMEDAGTSTIAYHRMRDAMAEIRAMLDGE